MIRILMAAGLAAAPMAAQAQSTDSFGGVVVEGQPREAYVVRVPTGGKTDHAVREEIWSSAWTACQRAPRTNNMLETRPAQTQWCAREAAEGALKQFDVMSKNRPPGGFVDASTQGR